MPSAGLPGISGVESGKDAPLVGGPPGVELHTVVDVLPSGDTTDRVPVALPTIGVGIVTNGVAGVIAVDDIVVADGDVEGIAETTVTVGVPGVICPVGVEQVTTVAGVVGSEAIGTGANVVSGAPGWVVAENGLGPLIGELTIVPGVN